MNTTSKLSARDRINYLLDDNSFVEIGALITRRSTDFNLAGQEIPSDGVVTGYGIIHGNLVYVYSQDTTALNGTVGEMHAKKIAHIYDLALKVGAPVIGLIDSAGIRLQEATDALSGFGEIYQKQAMASGIIPQITAVLGTCGGGLAVLTSLSDFSFMAEDSGKLFVNSPNVIEGNYTAKCDTSSAKFQASAGNIDFVLSNETEVMDHIRELIAIIPSNNEDDASFDECNDDLNRLIGDFTKVQADMEDVLSELSDDKYFMEVKKNHAKEMITGFIRLNGMTVGVVANQKTKIDDNGNIIESFEPVLTTAGAYKAEKFIRLCDAYEIPLLSLTNVEGFAATATEEQTIGLASAKLTYAFSSATVPKVNVITSKAFGSAYITMNSKHIGSDFVFALEGASIGMMEPKSAAQIMYQSEPELVAEKALEYSELQASAVSAARRGHVDAIIDVASTRKHLIYAFEMLFTKRVTHPSKKRGTI